MAWTLQKLIDDDMTVTAWCNACNAHRELDLPALRDRFGPDAPAMRGDLVPKLKCVRCGGKNVGLIYMPASNALRTQNL